MDHLLRNYDSVISSGIHTFRNYRIFRSRVLSALFRRQWTRAHGGNIEGQLLPDAEAVREAIDIPVLCTGGFQTASIIRRALEAGQCDVVTIARPLIANNDLVKLFEAGEELPARPCTYCNKCMVNAVENPLGCYEESRFASYEEMIAEIMSVFEPPPFG